ncbi:MAG TPA: nitrate/nitrite transporter NrtS [Allocoleopsis sp.]
MKGIRGYLASLFDKEFIPTGFKTALFVGSLLFLINHGPAVLQSNMSRDRWISGALTYLMPYLVNVYGQYASRARSQPQPLVREAQEV